MILPNRMLGIGNRDLYHPTTVKNFKKGFTMSSKIKVTSLRSHCLDEPLFKIENHEDCDISLTKAIKMEQMK